MPVGWLSLTEEREVSLGGSTSSDVAMREGERAVVGAADGGEEGGRQKPFRRALLKAAA